MMLNRSIITVRNLISGFTFLTVLRPHNLHYNTDNLNVIVKYLYIYGYKYMKFGDQSGRAV
jgi:hypothetical protein